VLVLVAAAAVEGAEAVVAEPLLLRHESGQLPGAAVAAVEVEVAEEVAELPLPILPPLQPGVVPVEEAEAAEAR